MHILAISDLHGFLPDIPKCDLLLLGGDYCPTRNIEQERRFMLGPFAEWLKQLPARNIVGIAGNHDFILQREPELARDLPWVYLQDEHVNLNGISIYGTPWTPVFYDWAFMDSDKGLQQRFRTIPEGLDILLTHGPAYKRLDKTQDGTHAGSLALLERVRETKPRTHVFGHIHEARGKMEEADTRFYNVTHVTLRYEPKYDWVTISI